MLPWLDDEARGRESNGGWNAFGDKNDAALATRLGMCRGKRDSDGVSRNNDEIGSGFARGDGDGSISPVDGDGYTGIFRDG